LWRPSTKVWFDDQKTSQSTSLSGQYEGMIVK
jgi:hypothetical protein